jgi:hypothetical protein
VSITGKLSFAVAGSVTISGIRLTTNSDNFLAVTGNAASIVNLDDCFLNCFDTTGISFTTSNASATINLNRCRGNLATTGIGLYSMSATGLLSARYCNIGNTGLSTTASSNSAGKVICIFCNFGFPLSTSSSGVINFNNSNVNTADINTTGLTTAGTGSHVSTLSSYSCGSASAISVGAGTSLNISSSVINSTNANSITGAGTLNYTGLSYTNLTGVINTTTVNSNAFGRTGTWTPGVAFGGASVGVTYGLQLGLYTQIGNVVYITGKVILTSKGSSVGTATMTGLPITGGANTYADIAVGSSGVFTLTATYTNIGLSIQGATTSAFFFISANSAGGAVAQATNTMFANTSQWSFSGFYIVA